MLNRKIVLASKSPRRRQLLEQIGLEFEIRESEYEEDMGLLADPIELVKLLALNKAEAVKQYYDDAIIIAADTFVVFDGKFLGKPKDKNDARRMLQLLNGKTNSIITGFAVLDLKSGVIINDYDQALVIIRSLTDQDIENYIITGEPMDKAGAFGIQGVGAVIIERVDGDYHNIMGLPLSKIYMVLKDLGVDVLAVATRQ